MIEKLLKSRRFWLAVLAVVVTGLGVVAPNISPLFIDALQKFAVILIAAFTIEDTAVALSPYKED